MAVDIGGACKRGRPPMPKQVVVDGSTGDSGTNNKGLDASGGKLYGDLHPASNEELEIDSSSGAIRITKEAESTIYEGSDEPLGKVGVNYITGPRGSAMAAPVKEDIQGLIKELSDAIPADAPVPVENIEVLFTTSIGVIVSYYKDYVDAGQFFILISDTSSRSQKFIPSPTAEGTISIDIQKEGALKVSYTLLPVGINFTYGTNDFFVFVNKTEV